MAFIYGKLTRKVSKQYKEYFIGRVGSLPVMAFWAKKSQDDLCLFLDTDKINFLADKNKTKSGAVSQEENKPQPL